MALATSVGSRFLTKILIIGGLASSPLLLNSEITLAQSYSNYRDVGCTYEGDQTPYVFAVTGWSGASANSTVSVQALINRYSVAVLNYVPVGLLVTDRSSGANGVVSAISISDPDVNYGFFRGDTTQNSSFFPVLERQWFKTCLPPVFP